MSENKVLAGQSSFKSFMGPCLASSWLLVGCLVLFPWLATAPLQPLSLQACDVPSLCVCFLILKGHQLHWIGV